MNALVAGRCFDGPQRFNQVARVGQIRSPFATIAGAAIPRIFGASLAVDVLNSGYKVFRAFQDLVVFAGLIGFDNKRSLPQFKAPYQGAADGEVLLFADTFNRHFDPETLRAAERVIARTGRTV